MVGTDKSKFVIQRFNKTIYTLLEKIATEPSYSLDGALDVVMTSGVLYVADSF